MRERGTRVGVSTRVVLPPACPNPVNKVSDLVH